MSVANNAARMTTRDTSELPIAAAPATKTPTSGRGWIESTAFDLCLFTLSPLAGFAVVLAAMGLPRGMYVLIVATYLVAIPHYVSSFSFYLGDENLAYYRTRRLAFFGGPCLILLTVFGLRLLQFDGTVQATMYVWNVYHVSLQSCGILAIYRRLNGGQPSEKRFAQVAILASNATLAFWYIDRFPPLYGLLLKIHIPLPAIRLVLLGISTTAVFLFVNRLRRRPHALALPELAFLISTFLLFNFFLWVRDLNLATFGMLMGHFLQYLGMVWLLNRRKYSESGGSVKQRFLARVSTSTPLLLGSLTLVGALFYVAQKGSSWIGEPITYVILWNALALVHFYIDGLVWAFRNPFVRESIGGYLMPKSRMVLQ
jgi:hypothetical protein